MKTAYHAIMAVDPGTATGVAVAVVGARGTMRRRLDDALRPVTSGTLRGSYVSQAHNLMTWWAGLTGEANLLRNQYREKVTLQLAIEDYILIRFDSSEREGLDTVRVTSAFMMALALSEINPPEPYLQQPSQAATYATDDRLRHWGLWLPGGKYDHERSARKHLCLRIGENISRNAGSKPKKGTG